MNKPRVYTTGPFRSHRLTACRASAARPAGRRGTAYIVSLVLLSLFSALAMALMTGTQMNLQQGKNQATVMKAQLAAESGLSFLLSQVSGTSISAATEAQVMQAVAGAIQSALGGTATLGGQDVAYDGETMVVSVPAAQFTAGETFTASLYMNAGKLRLYVTGSSGGVSRSVSLDFDVQGGPGGFLDVGIAAKGPVEVSGQGKVKSADPANNPRWADVLSATTAATAYSVGGQAEIDGDIMASNPDAGISLSGSHAKIGGVDVDEPEVWDHIHVGQGSAEFPTVDPEVFRMYADGDIVSPSSPVGSRRTFTNLLVEPNSNPTFASDTTLNGVVFIKKPNRVHFAGKATVLGVIVTEDAEGDTENNKITFSGQTTATGMSGLPTETPHYEELQALVGSFLLAPGFEVSFSGQVDTIGGTMAAEKFSFTGQAAPTIYGTLISFGAEALTISGQGLLTFDRSGQNGTPAGFTMPCVLVINCGTYQEH